MPKPKAKTVTFKLDIAKIKRDAKKIASANGSLESSGGTSLDHLERAFNEMDTFFPRKFARAFYDIVIAIREGEEEAMFEYEEGQE